jgi:hypothetical protein
MVWMRKVMRLPPPEQVLPQVLMVLLVQVLTAWVAM